MRRIQWGSIFDTYLASFCDEEGVQESNLTREEQAGLKSLKKRIKEGSLVICMNGITGKQC